MRSMRAVILAGGKGTRLRPYTTVLPKPLLPVGERPILEMIIRQLAAAGFDRVDLCLGHLGGLIRTYFDEGTTLPSDIELRYHWEDEPLGTAGALRMFDPADEPLLVMNGDIMTTLDYAELMKRHVDSNAALTIASYQQIVQLSLGVIENDEGVVSDYIEKPALNYEVSMGVYVYDPRAIAAIPVGAFDFPDLVLKLVAAGERVETYKFDGEWFDIGTPEQYDEATEAFEREPHRYAENRD